jgi:hypothetical protein
MIDNLVYKMLVESTGTHFLDSGGDDNRHWQRNAKKSIEDFKNSPQVEYEVWNNSDDNLAKLDDISVTIPIFQYLTNVFELDYVANEFNSKFDVMSDFESDWNFISEDAQEWLVANGFELVEDKQNTYNFDNYFSQDMLFTHLKYNDDDYYLISIHNGADVRGGYTDAKLFKLPYYYEMPFYSVFISGFVNGVSVSNQNNGVNLNIDDDNFEGDVDDFKFPKDCEVILEWN